MDLLLEERGLLGKGVLGEKNRKLECVFKVEKIRCVFGIC